MSSSLQELPLPVRIVPATPISDDDLIAFSRANEPYRIEKNAQGDIIVITPTGQRGDERETDVAAELIVWARRDGRGRANGANAGWNLPDGSMLSPDASWTSNELLARFTLEERERYLPICPEFIIEARLAQRPAGQNGAVALQWSETRLADRSFRPDRDYLPSWP